MYARVARWEGLDADSIRGFSQMIESSDGPPPGVQSSGIMVLSDVEKGVNVVIGLFDSEEDMRAGDAALRAMDRPADAKGEITSIDFYEVTANRSA